VGQLIRFLTRSQIDDAAWNACVDASPQAVVYGQSWYLDAVADRWAGLVQTDDAGQYVAVMPLPLRHKRIAGLPYLWTVNHPLFCQFLGLFARTDTDAGPFFAVMRGRYRFGAGFSSLQAPPDTGFESRPLFTHVLDLSVGYDAIRRGYSRDRLLNLRRAEAANWTVRDSTDPEPMLQFFRDNHADGITKNGVAEWAYDRFRGLFAELQRRGLTTLRYAERDGQAEAGAFFVQHGNRIIYLFNAATPAGRRGNARTLLLDQMIREQAGQLLLFDFESPEKPDIVRFYQSFGAVPEQFWRVSYDRLTWPEHTARTLLRWVRQFV
jgi:hypothetical protein